MTHQRYPYPSPQTTLLILLGASDWPDDEEFRASEGFTCAAQKVTDYFLQTYGIPQAHMQSYFDDPRNVIEITDSIYSWLEKVKGEANDLIIYYIGHGKHTFRYRQLYLAMRGTKGRDPEGTSLKVDSLVKAVKNSHLRRYYIFDCCFAATAISDLQGTSEEDLLRNTLEDQEIQANGWTALFSSGKDKVSIILPDATNTFFSEALLQALQNSLPSGNSPLSFSEVHPRINEQLEALYRRYRFCENVERPPIAQTASGDLFNMPIFPNLNQSGTQTPRLEVKGIQQIIRFIGHEHGITALALSPDSQTLVSGDEKGQVRVWDIAKRTSVVLETAPGFVGWLFGPTKASVTSIVFHPEGRTFYTGWKDKKIKLWSAESTQILESLYSDHAIFSPDLPLAISPDGQALVSAGRGEIDKNMSPSGGIHRVRVRSLSIRAYSRTDKVFVLDNYPYIDKFSYWGDYWETITSIAFSSKGRFFAASSISGTTTAIRIWDILQGKERPPLENSAGSDNCFRNIVFHPDENLFAAVNEEGQCLIWDLSTGNIQRALKPLSEKITAITFSPDGYHLAAAHSSGVIGFWNPFSEELIHSFQAHDQSISLLVYSSDGYHLVSGSLDKTIKVWGNQKK